MQEQPDPKDLLSQAARLLGKRSYPARLKRYGKQGLKAKLSAAGKAAGRTGAPGRPRLPDSKVKSATLYQRERRAQLRAEAKLKREKKVR
jgi:hypothetical protein